MHPLSVDPKLLEFATPRQKEVLEKVIELGSAMAAATALGMHKSTPGAYLKAVKQKAALAGYAPEYDMRHPVPEPFRVKGVSTYYDSEGKPRGQWVKSDVDRERALEMVKQAVEAMATDIKPAPLIDEPSFTLKHLLTLYTFTDYHVGMLAWHKEGGDDWDLQIAENIGVAAMQSLVSSSPPADTGVINLQGDFLHFDGLAAVTPSHGHVLDADGRFGKVVDVAIKLVRQLAALALKKHKNVILLIAEGNHDLASSLWLRKLFKALYENEPRIVVHDSELPYYAIEWGETMLGFHHGHLKKNDQLPLLFAAQFSAEWGRTKKRYIHTGHRHHKEDREHAGARVIQHPTLAARDAYAARGGWFSERAMTAMTFHKSFGEVATNSVCPEMLQ